MKRITTLLLCILIILCGCAVGNEDKDNTSDSFVLSETSDLYDDIIEDYRNIVSFRMLDDFDYFWNYGEFIELSDPLLQALTVSGSDIDYRWSNMIVEMPYADSVKGSFGYILTDINGDSSPELFWVRDDHTVLAAFTVFNDRIIILDAFWSRYSCVITEEGYLFTMGSGGAAFTDFEIRELSADGALKTVAGFSAAGNEYSEFSDGEYISIDADRFDELTSEYPFENSQRWLETEITPIF